MTKMIFPFTNFTLFFLNQFPGFPIFSLPSNKATHRLQGKTHPSQLPCASQAQAAPLFATGSCPDTTIKECTTSPMTTLTAEVDSRSPVIKNCTSSGLIKTAADKNRGCLLSGEIYDVLFKLMKSDEENATGDVQALCQLWGIDTPLKKRGKYGTHLSVSFGQLRFPLPPVSSLS